MTKYLHSQLVLLLLATIGIVPVLAQTTPSPLTASRCGSGLVTFRVKSASPGVLFKWYRLTTGGTALQSSTDTTYTTTVYQTTTLFVSKDSSGLESARVPVTATVLAAPRNLAAKQAKAPETYFLNLPFDGSLRELSGNAVRPTANANISYVADRHGNPTGAASFAGGQNAGLTTASSFSSTQAFTISFWMLAKPQTTFIKLLTGNNSATGVSTNRDRDVNIETSGRLSFYTFNTNPQTVSPTKVVTDSTWHHILISAQSNNRVIFYIDGVKYIDQQTTGGYQPYNLFWRVGFDPSNAVSQSYNGLLDDFRIYNYAMNPDQLEALVNPGPALSVATTQFCSGSIGQTAITLNRAQPGVLYRLTKDTTVVDSVVALTDTVVLTTDTVYQSSTYRILATNTVTGCTTSLDSAINIAVGVKPDTLAPQVVTDCVPGAKVISYSVGPGESVRWYDAMTSTIPLTQDTSFTTRVLGSLDTVRYYAARVNLTTGCEGERALVTVASKRLPQKQANYGANAVLFGRFNKSSRANGGTAVTTFATTPGVRDTTDRFGYPNSALYLASGNRVTNGQQIQNPQLFTLSIWFKTGLDGLGGEQTLVAFNNTSNAAGNQHDRALYLTSAGQLAFFTFGGGGGTLASGRFVADDAWHHVTVTHSNTGAFMYLDGQLVAENLAMTSAQAYNGFWRLGQRQLDRSYTGLLDDFAYFNRVLTPAEVAELSRDRLVVTNTNTVFCAPGGSVKVSLGLPETTAAYSLLDAQSRQVIVAEQVASADTLVFNTPVLGSSVALVVVGRDTLTGCTHDVSSQIAVIVNPLPLVPFSRDTIACGTSSGLFRASGAGAGDVYRWYLDSSSTAPIVAGANPVSGPTLTVNGLQPGDSTVRWVAVQSAAGCQSARVKAMIRWVALPVVTLTPNTTQILCSGDSLLVRAPRGFASYQWSNGATTDSIYVRAAGTYNVRVTNLAGCATTSANLIVTQTVRPGQPVLTLTGNNITSSIPGGTTGVNYRWFRNGVQQTGRTTANLTLVAPQDTGSWVLVAIRGICSSDTSAPVVFRVTNLAQATGQLQVALRPNPATDWLMIDGLAEPAELTVFDIAGKLVSQQNGDRLFVQDMPLGTYRLVIRTGNGTAIRRFIKE